jgi:hypothetical protein
MMRTWVIKTFAAGVLTGLLALASLHPVTVLAKSVMAYGDHLQDVFAAVHQAENR